MIKNSKYFTLFGVLLLGLIYGFALKSNKGKVSTIKTVVIDAGHGGKDPGCLGAHHNEKTVALAVALKLGKIIEAQFKDVKVIYTRTTDVFVDLEERAQIANRAKADLFISIHCNAAGKAVMVKDKKTGKLRAKTYKNKKGKIVVVETSNPEPFGTETYVMGLKNEEGKMKVAARENSVIFLEDDYQKKYDGFDPESEESYIIMSNYTSSYVIQSANLALKIQEEYKSKAGRIDKGVHRQSIWVLWRTGMPSILTEIGYLTNPLEEQFLGSEKGQEYLAKAIFRGLRRYKDELEGNKRQYNDEFENQEPLENENIKAGNPIYGKKKEASEDVKEDVTDVDSTKKEKVSNVKKSDLTPPPKPIDPEVKKEIVVKKIDSLPKSLEQKTTVVVKTNTDSLLNSKSDSLSAKSIAALYVKKTETLLVTPTEKETPKVVATLVFKVQFWVSDKEIDLKKPIYQLIEKGTYYKTGANYKYVSGNFLTIAEAKKHQLILLEAGFKEAFVVAFKNGSRIDLNEARQLVEANKP